jgi:uncharacterized protein YndB with AHSA1/START domain
MFKKILKYFILPLILLLCAMTFFSPFKTYNGFNYKMIKTDIIINAPVKKVFAYLSNSANASKWSTYVNHITPLNTNEIADGQIGSTRRCFKQKDEQGIVWDEKIVLRNQDSARALIIYNTKGFPIMSEGLETQQLYKIIDSNKTQLSLTLFFEKDNANLMDKLKMHFASYIVNFVFEKNLNNIKYFNEH